MREREKKNEKEKGKKKRSQRERKRKKIENIFLLGEDREFNNFFYFLFLASHYSAQPFKLKKFSYSTIATACILSISGAKNSNIAI